MTATNPLQELREALMLLDAVTVARDRAEYDRDSLRSTLEAVQATHYALSQARSEAEALRDAQTAHADALAIERDQLRALNLALTKDLRVALARMHITLREAGLFGGERDGACERNGAPGAQR